MQNIRHGKAHVFGDNINTDIISPPQYMELPPEEGARHAMGGVDPDFAARVRQGDFVVAGSNFGSGSSRELAPLSLKYLGVGAIIAKTFARIFYRNAINLGLPAVECAETNRIRPGDTLTVDLTAGIVTNETRKETYACSSFPAHIFSLLQKGGLIAYLKETMPEKSKGAAQ